jgi:hypothetical protein
MILLFNLQEWERNLLIDDVVPYLQAYARRLGFEFRLAEMRWGIRDDASSSHQTSDICMAELERCKRESKGFFYVFLGYVLCSRVMRGRDPVSLQHWLVCARDLMARLAGAFDHGSEYSDCTKNEDKA